MKKTKPGQRYGRLVVLSECGRSKDRHILWSCICDCGNKKVVSGKDLRNGHTRSCGCFKKEIASDLPLMKKRIYPQIQIGQKFDKLTVIKDTGERKHGKRILICKCDCGKETLVLETRLSTGHTKSCGCYRSEHAISMNTTHGGTGSRLYRIWRSMKTRCTNPCSKAYAYYGGRGITVCSEWMYDFEAFHKWAVAHGYNETLTIDRINNDGNYEPQNCRWATYSEQARNKRKKRSG